MSAYGKPPLPGPQNHGNSYESGRPFPDGAFAYPAPIYGQPSVNPSTSSSAFPESAPMTQLGYQLSQPRATYDDQAGPYLNVGASPVPVVKDFSPQRGSSGTRIHVSITTLYELSSDSAFYLVFGQRKVSASLTKTGQQGSICQYSISADVPHFSAIGWSAPQVPFSLYMESVDGDVIAKVEVGSFTYVENPPHASMMEQSRKRKYSIDTSDLNGTAKRFSNQMRPKEEFGQYGNFSPNEPSTYSPYLPTNTGQQASAYNTVQQYRPANYQPQRNIAYPYSSSASPSNVKEHAPIGTWSPSYPPLSSMMRSPGMVTSGLSRSLPSPETSANPPLVRTSSLQLDPSPSNTPHGNPPPYNSYAIYSHRAQLDLEGDLDSMTRNWSADEWEAHRRLVVFTRSQSGSTIKVKFRKVTAEERPSNSICVSCIMWAEKKECFITSVEIIALLEQLVAARFTVEEKNRIRRNLEGFRPLTVSKGKQDSEEFFKVIMAFPPPKPRNIEKDVKVFHWKDLTQALKKIIGKYSATPSSTLPPTAPLLTPVSSTGYLAESSTATLSYADDHHGALSPRSMSATSTIYGTNPNSTHVRMSPPSTQKPMMLQTASDMRIAIPHPNESSQWHQGGSHIHGPQYQQTLPNQGTRVWDMSSSYMESPASAGSTSLPPHNHLGYSTPNTIITGPRNMDNSGLALDEDRRLSSTRRHSQPMP